MSDCLSPPLHPDVTLLLLTLPEGGGHPRWRTWRGCKGGRREIARLAGRSGGRRELVGVVGGRKKVEPGKMRIHSWFVGMTDGASMRGR